MGRYSEYSFFSFISIIGTNIFFSLDFEQKSFIAAREEDGIS